MAIFKLANRQQHAAQLLANGELTDTQIAETIGVSRQTLWSWKQRPEFAALVDDHLARFREEVRRRGLAVLERRVRALNDRWTRLQRIIEARADHPDYAQAPGGTTGPLVRTVKQIGSGESAREVEEFAVDVGLLKELREHERQAAQELGQWVEKRDVDQRVRARLGKGWVLTGLTDGELDALDDITAKIAGVPPAGPNARHRG